MCTRVSTRVSWSARLALLSYEREYVVLGHRVTALIRHVGVPAHLAIVGVGAGGDLLGGERHRELVAGLDRGEEAEVLHAVVGSHRPGLGCDKQSRRQR